MESKLKGPYSFYDNTITLWFDAEKHIYLRDNEPQDGVTSVLQIINKSEVLIPWAAKKVAERALQLIPIDESTILESDPFIKSIKYSELSDILNRAKKAPKEIKEDAGDVGTLAHNCLEDSINHAIKNNAGIVQYTINNPTEARAISCVNAAFEWMKKHHVIWIQTERKIYSREYEYAGTMDGMAWVSSCDDIHCCPDKFENIMSVIDWKSSNGLWMEYGIQVASYAHAQEEEFGSQIDSAFILRLGKEDGKFEPWRMDRKDLAYNFEAFVDCLDLTRSYRELKKRFENAKKSRSRKRLTKSK